MADMTPDEMQRLTRIAAKAAKSVGASASVLANSICFDVMTERWSRDENRLREYDGLHWFRYATRDVYLSPGRLGWKIRREIKEAWS